MTNFRNLKIWQKGMELVINVYKLSEMLPKLGSAFELETQLLIIHRLNYMKSKR